MSSAVRSTYASRAANFENEAARALLETMERKQTNLCVSVDVTKKADLLAVVRAVASFVCLVKVSRPRLRYTAVRETLIDWATADAHRYRRGL